MVACIKVSAFVKLRFLHMANVLVMASMTWNMANSFHLSHEEEPISRVSFIELFNFFLVFFF